MNENSTRFDKTKAPSGHNGTILAGPVLPEGMDAPFGHAWGYLEGESMMEGHSHPTDEVYLVFSGRGYCHIEDEIFPAVPGDIIRIPRNAYHTMECKAGEVLLWAALWWEPI